MSAASSSFSLSASGSATATAARESKNLAALDALADAIERRYSYRDRTGTDWKKVFADARPRVAAAGSPEALAGALAELLASAEDPHVVLKLGTNVYGTDKRPLEQNFKLETLKKRVTDWRFPNRCLALGKLDGVAYVLVNSLEKGRCDGLVDAFERAWPELEKADGLILDLRGNQGGNEEFAQKIAGRFVAVATPYVAAETRDASAPGGFGPRLARVLEPAGKSRYDKPVVVLEGPLVVSSAESFVLMMRVAGATLVGTASRGSSGKPQPIDLGDGLTVMLPSWRAYQVDGTLLEGAGVKPDVEVPTKPSDFEGGQDPVLDKAVALLREKRRAPPKRR